MVLDLDQGRNIQFWEVPETSQRDFLRQKLYDGAAIALLVYDVTSLRCEDAAVHATVSAHSLPDLNLDPPS